MARVRSPATIEDLLFSQGFGTRRECRALCTLGHVAVAGSIIEDPDASLDATEGMAYAVRGEGWLYHARAYIALNKPAGYECSHKPIRYPSVYTLLPAPFLERDVQAVGRLDADTTGLLLLSDDGQFIHRVASGKRHLPKIYEITAKHPIDAEQCERLLAGVVLDDDPMPVKAASCEPIGPSRLRLTITTGKYHQVKRMIAAVGNRVESLHRSEVGQFELPPNMAEGCWQWITPEQVFGASKG